MMKIRKARTVVLRRRPGQRQVAPIADLAAAVPGAYRLDRFRPFSRLRSSPSGLTLVAPRSARGKIDFFGWLLTPTCQSRRKGCTHRLRRVRQVLGGKLKTRPPTAVAVTASSDRGLVGFRVDAPLPGAWIRRGHFPALARLGVAAEASVVQLVRCRAGHSIINLAA